MITQITLPQKTIALYIGRIPLLGELQLGKRAKEQVWSPYLNIYSTAGFEPVNLSV